MNAILRLSNIEGELDMLSLLRLSKPNTKTLLKQRKLLFTGLLLVGVSISWGVYADSGFTVSGTFTLGNTPVADNGYIYFSAGSGSHGAAYTDSNGAYSIQNLTNDQYYASISNSGSGDGIHTPRNFSVQTLSTINVAGADRTADFVFPTSTLSVVVKDSSGAALSHVNVSAHTNDGTIYDNSQNAYHINDITNYLSTGDTNTANLVLPNGVTYTICATTIDSVRQCVTQAISGDTPLEIDVPAAYSASGVVAVGSTPIADNGYLTVTDSHGSSKSIYTDGSGQYAFSGLISDAYRVTIMNGGTGDGVNSPTQLYVNSSGSPLTVANSDTHKDFEFPKAQVSVTLKNDSNTVVPNGRITATAGGGTVNDLDGDAFSVSQITSQHNTDATGETSLAVIPGTTYTICGSFNSVQSCSNVAVSGDMSITIQIATPHTLSGTFSLGGNPVADQGYVITEGANGTMQNAQYTDDNGRFSFNNLVNGQYAIRFMNSGSGDGINVPQQFSVDSDLGMVTINGSDVTKNFDFPVAYLTVTVKDGSAVVPGARITANSQSGTVKDTANDSFTTGQITTSARSDSNGRAKLPLIPGTTYSVCVEVNVTQQCTLVALSGDQSVTLSSTTTPPSPTLDQAVNAGGSASGSYAADSGFSGGTTYSSNASVDTSNVTNPAPQDVYQTVRYGNNFSYTFSGLIPGATYTVVPQFNELYWGTSSTGGGIGSRVFNVSVNGQNALTNYDIFKAACGANRAVTEQIATTADVNGKVVAQFSTVTDNAMVNGLELYDGELPAQAPHSACSSSNFVNAGGSAVGDFAGDANFSGGTTYSSNASVDTGNVTNPAPQGVYQTVRYGNFSYVMPDLTPNTTYNVRLDFNELYWGALASGGVGSRVFNVSINGTSELSNFDIYAEAGGANKALAKDFTVTSDADGKITIQFTTVTDNAVVSGIEITKP